MGVPVLRMWDAVWMEALSKLSRLAHIVLLEPGTEAVAVLVSTRASGQTGSGHHT